METIKKNQSVMKDTLTEMKNKLQGINSRVHEAENQINNLKYKKREKTQRTTKRKKEYPKMKIE